MTGHDIFVEQTGACPWCGGEAEGECPEPDGQAEVSLDVEL